MPLVNAKCTNCGAVLQVEENKDALICDYCKSAFIVEKAINNYNINNVIHANVVNVVDQNKNFIIKGGVLEKYVGEDTNVIIPDNVVVIGKGAFKDMLAIENIQIPSSVEEICDNAFENCQKIKNITLPNSVKKIGSYVFCNCISLEKVNIPQQLYVEIPEGLFKLCEKLNFNNSNFELTEIVNKNAFQSTNIDSMKYFKNIKKVGEESFSNCKLLKEVRLPEGTIEIKNDAFCSCTNLEIVSLPSSMVSVWFDAFSYCHNLKEVILFGNIDNYMHYKVFSNCPNIDKVNCPNVEYSPSLLRRFIDDKSIFSKKVQDDINNSRCFYCHNKFTTRDTLASLFNADGIKCRNCGKYNKYY